jgi:hypothetical protein
MEERHDGSALFEAFHVHGDCHGLHWKPARHAEALAAFCRLRIRPRRMEEIATISGGTKWVALVTHAATAKLRAAKLSVTELLLD